ncbi:MAG: hypothetical protein LBR27_04315 [Bifidobacteriaceae bacterium]|jgi:hypothetical protein|nr:hypothetical protein [Bifidobacteriaceae bacterium]
MAQVRVYLPLTVAGLADEMGPATAGGPAFAVTPALRRAAADDDLEYLEYLAFEAAWAACAAGGPAVVISADVGAQAVRLAGGGAEPAAVQLAAPVTWDQVAAIHVEDADGDMAWYDASERASTLLGTVPCNTGDGVTGDGSV